MQFIERNVPVNVDHINNSALSGIVKRIPGKCYIHEHFRITPVLKQCQGIAYRNSDTIQRLVLFVFHIG